MRIKEIILLFVLLLLVSASAKPVNNNMVSVHLQMNSRDEEIIHHIRFSHGSSGGGHGGGGRSTGSGENVNGGQSQGGGGRSTGAGENVNGDRSKGGGGRSTGAGENVNGGQSQGSSSAAVIPIYAGGAAAGRHNNHRNAATCSHYSIGLPTLIAAVSAYMLAHTIVVLEF